jgi:hypothetical protein
MIHVVIIIGKMGFRHLQFFAMDMAGGQLSMQGIEVLQNKETAGIKHNWVVFFHHQDLSSNGCLCTKRYHFQEVI